MIAYIRAYIQHRRSPSDLYYGWRCWDCAEIVRRDWGW